MGVFGWEILKDDVTLRGTVKRHGFNGVDGDWWLSVEPLPEYARLLRNPTAPAPTVSGRMDCEVEPPNRIGPYRAGQAETEALFFGPLDEQTVTITGSWVADCGHMYHGREGLPVPHCKRGKTEIHPIASLLFELPPQGATRRIELFVFSDASLNVPARVPHSGENWRRTFRVEFPQSPSPAAVPRFAIRPDRFVNEARSADFEIVRAGGKAHLQAVIDSGTPREGKGFYHAVVDLSYASA
jgi:hypothetical protein